MTTLQKCGCTVLGLNLALAIWSVSYLPYPNLRALNYPFLAYREMSGTNYRWGFFAPTIGSQFRVQYEARYAGGLVVTGQIGDRGPDETVMRQQGVIATFWFALQDKIARRSLGASWARYVFRKYPGAESVKIYVDSFKIPSMAEFRSGKKGTWIPAYESYFSHEI